MNEASVCKTLREVTRDLHSDIENTAFAKALLNKAITRDAYVGYIRVLSVIHSALEHHLDSCKHPLVSGVWSEELRRLPYLLEDNDYFRRELIPDSPRAIQAALEAASHIRFIAQDKPVALLGCLYVLGGSSKGATILAPLVGQALEISGQGLSYLLRHSNPGRSQWEHSASVMDELVTDPADIEVMKNAAVDMFKYVLETFEALWPLDPEGMKYTAVSLNPESGAHLVSQSRDDLRAVIRATDSCLAEYPYFMNRYGKRGRRFSDADGAWLVTLPEDGLDRMQKQVKWLGGVLSARGIPRLLLARHMEILARELQETRPDHSQRSWILKQIAAEIRTSLQARLPRNLVQDRSRKLQQTLDRPCGIACEEAVELLASAVADEAEGLNNSVQSLVSWMADSARFSQDWVQAMHEEVKTLRQEVATEL